MQCEDFDLERGDDDARLTWGGVSVLPPAAVAASGPCNTLSPPAPVAELQRNLRTLGFLLAPEPHGVFDMWTEWAVREFQLYAKMELVAREDTSSQAPEYVDRLSQVPTGAHRYSGPVSGVVNAQTRAAIAHWLKESWRCPVVLDAWTTARGSPPTRAMRNLWLHTEGRTDLVVKVRDFTDYFQAQDPTDLWTVGKLARYKALSGPQSTVEHARQNVEVLPETLVGAEWSALGAAQRSTFKVVRAVAEIECYAFFDVVNWFYRYVMMGRTVASYRRSMWAKAIERIQKVCSQRFTNTDDVPRVGAGPNGQLATIGDVFTSELAMGYLLRWDVNRPADIRDHGTAGPSVLEALSWAKRNRSRLPWDTPPTQWTQAHEDALLAGLESIPRPNDELTRTLPQIASFPNVNPRWRMDRTVITALSRARCSFQLASATASAQPAQPPATAPPPQPPGLQQPPVGP